MFDAFTGPAPSRPYSPVGLLAPRPPAFATGVAVHQPLVTRRLCDRAFVLHELPIAQRLHAVGVARRLGVVRDEHDRRVALAADISQQRQDLARAASPGCPSARRRARASARSRAPGRSPPLALAHRELLRAVLDALAEPETLQQGSDPTMVRLARAQTAE